MHNIIYLNILIKLFSRLESIYRVYQKNRKVLKIMARFILETDDPSGRTWARKNSSSKIRLCINAGKLADGSSVKTNYLRSSSVQTDLIA